MDAGEEAVEEPGERDRLRRQARRVHLESAVAALALTALGVLLPA